MTSEQLAKALHDRYHQAGERQKVLSIHLFGIEFAEQLMGHSIKEICAAADVHDSYGTEIRKGMRLAEFVELKKGSRP